MAPVLRSTRSATKAAELTSKPANAEKRKAADDASPRSLKKQKGPKETKTTTETTKETKATKATETTKTAKTAQTAKAAAPVEAPSKSKKSSKKAPPPPEPEPESEPEVKNDSAQEDSDEQSEEEAQNVERELASMFNNDSDDESDAEPTDGSAYQTGMDVGKIPTPAASKKDGKKLKEITEGEATEPGVLYIGHIPHGFYEHQMREYFGQFGTVTRLRLSRNKVTGASKHYAFIEFADHDVADVAARTMDSYLLFGRILKVKLLAPEQVHPRLWIGANRRFKKIPWADLRKRELEKPRSESAWQERAGKERSRRTKRAAKLKEIGYEYEAPALKKAVAPPMAIEAAGGEGALAIGNGNGEEAQGLIEAPAEVEVQATEAVVESKAEEQPQPTVVEEAKTISAVPVKKPKAKKVVKGGKKK